MHHLNHHRRRGQRLGGHGAVGQGT